MRALRRAAFLGGGGILVTLGIVLMPLPGPGTPLVAGGLVLLSKESPRARLLLRRLKARWRAFRRTRPATLSAP